MSRSRMLAAGFFSAVIILILAVILVVDVRNSGLTLDVFVLKHDVLAGSVLSPSDLSPEIIPDPGGNPNYVTGSVPVAKTYALNLHAGDILRADDIANSPDQAAVNISIAQAPALSPGELVDIYALLSKSTSVLVGSGVPVIETSGGNITILVPREKEADWVAIASSGVSLHIARVVTPIGTPPDHLTGDQAVRNLCIPACPGLAPAPPGSQ